MPITDDLIGKRIVDVRPLTDLEMVACGWVGEKPPVAYVLSNGTLIVPAADAELNGPGVLLVLDKLTGQLEFGLERLTAG